MLRALGAEAMEEKYTIADAKNRLPALIHSVESGRAVELTRHGKPVAVLLSVKDYQRLMRKKAGFWDALVAFRNRVEKAGVVLTGEEFEGVRDHSPGRQVDLS
jgi:prevent-host-death family protein